MDPYSMGRPRSAIERATLSFYVDRQLATKMRDWEYSPTLNSHRLTAARAVEVLLYALVSGDIVIDTDPTNPRTLTVLRSDGAVAPPPKQSPVTLDINFTMTLNPDGSYTLTHKKDSE